MAVMSEEVQKLFGEVKDVVLSTVNADGQPNACIVGMKSIIDDETVYLSDQFFKKTLANIKQNPKVAIAFWQGVDAFVIHGTVDYVTEGPEFEKQSAWVNAAFEKMGMPIKSKGGCIVSVDAVYTSKPGPTAGDQIA